MENRKNIDAIYIHIPFCSKKCEYCDFCTFVKMDREFDKYVDYLIKEIRMHPKYEYDTIYFGGGTPSLLSVEQISKILQELTYNRNLAREKAHLLAKIATSEILSSSKGKRKIKTNEIDEPEITLELNPTHMDFEKLKKLREIGINRLSIGIQSFQNHVLKFIGREHTSEEAIKVFKMARKAGFDNITIDLMFGIPNQTIDDLKKDLEIIRELQPENVSIYSLIWEEGTVFWSKLQKGILSEIDQDLEAEMFEYIMDFFKENGYLQYEISNFCKKETTKLARSQDLFSKNSDVKNITREHDCLSNELDLQKNINYGRHNLKYWQNKEFVGVGMSAAGFIENTRASNVRTFRKYYNLIDEGKIPIDEDTIEIVDEIEAEKLRKMLGLRLTEIGIEYGASGQAPLLKDDNIKASEEEVSSKNYEQSIVEKLIRKGLLEKVMIEDIDENMRNLINEREENSARVRLTREGILLANDVFVEFI